MNKLIEFAGQVGQIYQIMDTSNKPLFRMYFISGDP